MKKTKMGIFLISCLLFVLLGAGSGGGGVEPRILIKDAGSDYKIFNLTTEVVNCLYYNFKRPFKINEKDIEKIGKDGIDLLNHLFKIEGITAISIEPYEVIIKRNQAFEWEEIEPKVLEILKERFGENRDKVKIIHPKAQSK